MGSLGQVYRWLELKSMSLTVYIGLEKGCMYLQLPTLHRKPYRMPAHRATYLLIKMSATARFVHRPRFFALNSRLYPSLTNLATRFFLYVLRTSGKNSEVCIRQLPFILIVSELTMDWLLVREADSLSRTSHKVVHSKTCSRRAVLLRILR